MPGFDGTGPSAQGSMTGRGLGKCTPQNNQVVEQNQRPFGFGRGMGKGALGRGRGCGRGAGFKMGMGMRRNSI